MGSHASAEAVRAVLDCVRRIVRALRESSREAERKVGISGAQLFVLQQIAAGQARSVSELADRTQLPGGAAPMFFEDRRRAGRSRGGSISPRRSPHARR